MVEFPANSFVLRTGSLLTLVLFCFMQLIFIDCSYVCAAPYPQEELEISTLENSGAFKPGFYPSSTTQTKISAFKNHEKNIESNPAFIKLDALIQTADKTLYANNLDSIDIGLGAIDKGARNPLFLKSAEVEPFLKAEKHKNLIVFCLLSGRKTEIDKVKEFLLRLGYKRILITRVSATGHIVLFDSLERDQ